jgi:hypothetical protein
MSREITRRRFLVLGSGAGLSAFLSGAYVVSACPLTDTGICVGPCAAYIDRRGDGLCDRAYADRAAQAVAQEKDGTGQASQPGTDIGPGATSPQASRVACPFGLVNDPYPGRCRRYIDRDGDGICDLSIPQDVGQVDQDVGQASLPDSEDASQAPPTPTTPQPQAGVACPFGLVNDPYPGRCRRYVDQDGDGICDLSEPGSGLSAPEDASQVEEEGSRRRRSWGNGRR